jgi:hypothetical protein
MKKLIALLVLTTSAGTTVAQHYSGAGELALPDYCKWVYLGSGLGMSYTETGRENPPFTNVFATPAAYDKFMKTGTWPSLNHRLKARLLRNSLVRDTD